MPRLEHVGIAVDEVADVVDCFNELLGVRPYKSEAVDEQQVRTHFLNAGETKLELLEALSDDSPVRRFVERSGEGIHHLAFEVSDADDAMATLRERGFTVLSETPQAGADDKRIFFVHPKETHGVLVEFCESTPPDWSPESIPHRAGHLSVFERGDRENPTVLFIHGAAGSTLLETAPLLRHLEPWVHAVGIDLSGHGASSFPPEDSLHMEVFLEDVLAALDAVDAASAHVFGFSLGGAVALRLAQTHPNSVDRLAVFQTNARWPEDLTARMKRRLQLDRLRERAPARAERMEATHHAPEQLFRELRSFVDALPKASKPMWRGLSDVTAPTLVASTDRDPLFGVDVPRSLQEALPEARLAILPGSRHSLPDAPLSVLAHLLRSFYLDDGVSQA